MWPKLLPTAKWSSILLRNRCGALFHHILPSIRSCGLARNFLFICHESGGEKVGAKSAEERLCWTYAPERPRSRAKTPSFLLVYHFILGHGTYPSAEKAENRHRLWVRVRNISYSKAFKCPTLTKAFAKVCPCVTQEFAQFCMGITKASRTDRCMRMPIYGQFLGCRDDQHWVQFFRQRLI